MTTTTETRTDIRVPPGTVPVLENEVLGPHADGVEDPKPDADAFAASAAWVGLKPGPTAHWLRFDLADPGERAGAVWLLYELKAVTSRSTYELTDPLIEKRDVLARIAQQLYDALRATEAVGVER